MKRQRKFFATLILTLLLILVTGVSVSAATNPGAVKLTKITAVDYDKINIKWKKTSGATNYIVYYKKSGESRWIKIKTLDDTKSSYTHSSSSKYPLVVGQKYQYTVKAYNKNTKKSGNYNTKGLTVNTSISTISGLGVSLDRDNHTKISWNKTGGVDKYIIYHKINGQNWTKIATVKSNESSYIDTKPIQGVVNYYTVRGYYSVTKTYGGVNSGTEIYVKKITTAPTPKPSNGNDNNNDDDDDDNNDDIDEPVDPQAFASEVLRLTNIERMKDGEQPLKYNKTLQDAAMLRAKEISVKFSHTRPNGTGSSTVGADVGAAGISGENIAMGYPSPISVVNGWMNSSGHRVTMLQSNFQYIGVGFYESNDGTYYWTQVFTCINPDSNGSITFDANGGIINGKSTFTVVGTAGQKVWLRDAPDGQAILQVSVPIRNGYMFDGWFLLKEPNDSWQPVRSLPYSTDGVTLYAKWIPNN